MGLLPLEAFTESSMSALLAGLGTAIAVLVRSLLLLFCMDYTKHCRLLLPAFMSLYTVYISIPWLSTQGRFWRGYLQFRLQYLSFAAAYHSS
jgi:hypothetical protein